MKNLQMPYIDDYDVLRITTSGEELSRVVAVAIREDKENPSAAFDELAVETLQDTMYAATVLHEEEEYEAPNLDEYEEIVVNDEFGLYEVVALAVMTVKNKNGKLWPRPKSDFIQVTLWENAFSKQFTEILETIYFGTRKQKDQLHRILERGYKSQDKGLEI